MNEGAAVATGNILLFLHVDTELPQDALLLIGMAMQDNQYVAGSFDLGIKSERLVFRIIEQAASIRSRVTRVPFGDQAIFMRKEYFDKVGGFREMPLMEDVEIMGRIKKKGDRIFVIPRRVLTSSRRWEEEGVFRCTLRNWLLQSLYLFGISPRTLARFYAQSR
jgi:rSAM/selenodomain-associated transferase 2